MRALFVIFCGVFALSSESSAQSTSTEFELEGRRFSLSLENGELRSGRFREVLGPDAAQIDDIQVVGVSAQRQVALVHVGTRRVLVRKQGAQLRGVWSGDVEWRGDPGGRRRDVVEVGDRNGDGVDDVVVGENVEGRVICGQDATLQ